MVTYWAVEGEKRFPTGYHDNLLYLGCSCWQAFKAVWVALRNGMVVTIERTPESKILTVWR
jgi:hypothetical protein